MVLMDMAFIELVMKPNTYSTLARVRDFSLFHELSQSKKTRQLFNLTIPFDHTAHWKS